MEKNYALLKRCIFALIFLLTTAIVIYSCKKDRPFTREEIKNELITDAKDFFQKDILSNKEIILNDQNYRHGLTKNLLWDNAYIRKISLGDAVIVPIKFGNDFQITKDNDTDYERVTSYLIIYRDAKDIRHAEWVTLIPNLITQYASERFIGTATVEDWNGNFIKAFAYREDGQIISVKLAESNIYKQISLRRLNCYTIHYYGHNYVEGVAGSDYWYENGSETYCHNENAIDQGPTGYDYGSDGGGAGVNGTFVNPDVINNFVLDKSTQDKYPKFTDLIKRLENFVANDKKVMDALIKWSGYNREQILEKVKYGKGPTIVVKEMTGKYGYFDRAENANVINIDASWVRGLESANLLETQEATGFFLGVTVLHEFVHQARAANGLDRNYEYGYGFEQSAFNLIIENDGAAPYNYRFRLYKK
jgi:hypothetical protein